MVPAMTGRELTILLCVMLIVTLLWFPDEVGLSILLVSCIIVIQLIQAHTAWLLKNYERKPKPPRPSWEA